jgi:hypothetical protein
MTAKNLETSPMMSGKTLNYLTLKQFANRYFNRLDS